MSKLSQVLHGLGNVLQKAVSSADPAVASSLGTIGQALHAAADLFEQKEAQAYLGPVIGVIVGNVLNAATDSAAADLNPNPAPVHGS